MECDQHILITLAPRFLHPHAGTSPTCSMSLDLPILGYLEKIAHGRLLCYYFSWMGKLVNLGELYKNSPSAWKHLCFSAFSLAFMLQTSLLSLLSLMSTFQCCFSRNIFCTIYPIGVKSFSELSSIPVCHYAVGAICITSIDLHRIAATLSWRSNTTLAATQC